MLPCAAIGGSREGGVWHWGEGGRDEATPEVGERGREESGAGESKGGRRPERRKEGGRKAGARVMKS